jgi:polysaccharide export outer membrane protein
MLHSDSSFASKVGAKTGASSEIDPQRADVTRAGCAVAPRAAAARRHAPALIAVAIAALLSGCALSPGMSFNTMSVSAAAARTNATGAQRPGTTDSAASGKADLPPSDAMVEITNDLITKQDAARPTGIPTDVSKFFAKPAPYTLGPGDILNIVVWDHPELNLPEGAGAGGQDATGSNSVVSGYTVDAAGMLQYAYIGPIKVQGMTEMEARDVMTKKLSRFLRNPQVTLRIQAYRSKRIYLDGEVRNPGLQMLNDMPMTLPEAINRAGGFTQTGDRSAVQITRGDDSAIVNIPDMIAKGVNPNNIMLRDGDLVRVFSANDTKVSVLGEVGRPGSFTLNNGRMTLSQALGDAGGISQTSGDASQVFVIRGRDSGKPTVFHLDADNPAAMATADSFELKPNDVVFVDASSLVRWSRVIGLILPSTQAAATGRALGF